MNSDTKDKNHSENEGSDIQSELAIWGIHLTLGLIPMIFLLIGTIIFWKLFDLTPSRVKEIKSRIKEIEK